MRLGISLVAVTLLVSCGGIRTKLCGQDGEPCCKETPTCGELLRCNDRALCEACGGPGQGCCAGSTCGAAAICDATNVCISCGAKNQACCAGSTCAEGLSCEANTCADKVLCATECTLGATRCSATGGIERCAAQGACPVWTVLTQTCPANTSCIATGSSADCVDPCPTRCTPNSVICAVNGLKRCVVPSGETCPALVTEPDNDDNPRCVTGAIVSPDLQWESPTPMLANYIDIAGDFAFSFWLLDNYGNIVHAGPGITEYEIRPTPGKHMAAIASCRLGNRLYAAGERGTIFKRGFGTWTEETVGENVYLIDVHCDTSLAFALSSTGKLFARFNSMSTVWTPIPTGFIGVPTAFSWSPNDSTVWIVGSAGTITKCTGMLSAATATCSAEAFPFSDDLTAVYSDPASAQTIVVSSQGHAFLHGSGVNWSQVDTVSAPGPLYTVHGYFITGDPVPRYSLGGQLGKSYGLAPPFTFAVDLQGETLQGVMALDDNLSLFVSAEGSIFRRELMGPLSPSIRGGHFPITETLLGVTSAGKGKLFAVGDKGGRYLRENLSWAPDSSGVALTTALTAVAAVSPSEVYAVGENSQVLVRRYGTWSVENAGAPAGQTLSAVTFDQKKIYVVGTNGLWLEKDRASGMWSQVMHGLTTQSLNGLAIRKDTFGNVLEVVAVGDRCTILSKKGDVFSLATVELCTAPLNGAAFTDLGSLFVVGDEGLIKQRTSTGFQTEYVDVNFANLLAVAADGETIYVTTNEGVIFRKTTNWTNFTGGLVSSALTSMTVDPADGLFIVGGHGVVLRKP